MKVLVAYASRHGSTAGIAERIAAHLTARGLEAEALPVSKVGDVAGYDAFVVGSALYMFRWLGEATKFVSRNSKVLSAYPTWLFGSGPTGPDEPNKQGKDPREVAGPRNLDALRAMTRAVDYRVFFGAFDPDAKPIGLAERFVASMPAAKAAMPGGDFRNWPEIDAWADQIAESLAAGR
jgi:menaquinone-dependent protoporphyrinogen oxidase